MLILTFLSNGYKVRKCKYVRIPLRKRILIPRVLSPLTARIQDTGYKVTGVPRFLLLCGLRMASRGKKQTKSSKVTSKGKDDSIPSVDSIASASTASSICEKNYHVSEFATSKEHSNKMKGREEIIAYVHQLSPLKRNKWNTMNYSTMVLQTSTKEAQEALVYSEGKRPMLADSERSHSPIKIQRFTYSSDGSKLIVNDMSKISTPLQTEYYFQYENALAPDFRMVSVKEIMTAAMEGEYIGVRGKIGSIDSSTVVSSRQLKVACALFADETGTIGLDLWQEHVSSVSAGKVY